MPLACRAWNSFLALKLSLAIFEYYTIVDNI
jgi:hypothetical protein